MIRSVSTLEWAIASTQPSKNTTVKERRRRDAEEKMAMLLQFTSKMSSSLEVEVASTAVFSHIFNGNTV